MSDEPRVIVQPIPDGSRLITVFSPEGNRMLVVHVADPAREVHVRVNSQPGVQQLVLVDQHGNVLGFIESVRPDELPAPVKPELRPAGTSACGKYVNWWEGEYEGNCELIEGHGGPHCDGMSWYDDDGDEVSEPREQA